MNAIYLLRHADAEPSDYYDDDHDRDLTMEGQRDARRLGQFLSATDQLPDQFICSTAVRARRTTELLPEGGQWMIDVPLRSTHALYEAQPADVLEEIQGCDSNVRAVMLVGHEPALSTTVGHLLGSANVSLPPGTCVRIDTQTDWSEIEFGDGVLRWMMPPKLLR